MYKIYNHIKYVYIKLHTLSWHGQIDYRKFNKMFGDRLMDDVYFSLCVCAQGGWFQIVYQQYKTS